MENGSGYSEGYGVRVILEERVKSFDFNTYLIMCLNRLIDL